MSQSFHKQSALAILALAMLALLGADDPATLEQIATDPAASNRARIDALGKLADQQIAMEAGKDLHAMDLSTAHATLQRALALPDLQPAEQAAALQLIAKLYERQDDFSNARATYERIQSLAVPDATKTLVGRSIADTYASEGKPEKAIAIYREHGLDLVPLYQKLGDDAARRAACEKVLSDPASTDAQRWTAFTRLPCWDWKHADRAELCKAVDTYLPSLLEKDPNRVLHLKRKFEESIGKEAEFVLWGAPLLLQAPKLSDADYAKIREAQVGASASLKKLDEAVALAREVSADARVSPATRGWAGLVAIALGGKADQLSGAVEGLQLDPKGQAEQMLRAARTAVSAGKDDAARRLQSIYDAKWPKPARAEITCRFVERAPFDVGSWLSSPLLKDGKRIDRPYGDNLKFLLETDSAMTGRNTSADNGAGPGAAAERTDLHLAADAEGLHLFIRSHDTRAAEVAAGLVSGGALEMYLAPGPHQAYYTFLAELPKAHVDPKAFITMYDNPMFRLPSTEEGTFRTQTEPVDGGFGTYLFLSWELFYDKLPSEGSKWQFEAIRWTRNGGFTFGGSESVHNRSSFGDVVFAGLSDEQLTKVQRRIVLRALAKYREAKRPTGTVGQWADPVLGDPAFHERHVAPLLKELDAYALSVKADLPADDVKRLFEQAVPAWMELPHRVAALRASYLQSRLLGE